MCVGVIKIEREGERETERETKRERERCWGERECVCKRERDPSSHGKNAAVNRKPHTLDEGQTHRQQS